MSASAILDSVAQWRSSLPRFDSKGLLPWSVDGVDVGLVTSDLAQRMLASDLFLPGNGGPMLREDIGGPISKTRALGEFAELLHQEGLVWSWRNEPFDYVDDWGRVRFSLERGAFRTLGLRSRAVHVNGYVGDDGLWLGCRAATKRIDPGRLDNLAAGGISSKESPVECLVRELAEEAGVPRLIALMATPGGVIHSRRREPDGVHDELLYCYDLQLSPNFAPVNCDGEVADFMRVDVHTAAARLVDMTWDSAAVTVEWLGRWLSGDV